MLTLALYLTLIITLTFLQKKEWFNSVFKSNKKVSWVISGLSLYMFYLSVDQGQFLTGLIAEHGMQGMWMVWAGWLGAFVVPIVFAPLWQKMDFITDNQFLLFRFPGKSGKILHLFRAIYVGGLVVALLLCFHVLGFSRVIQIYFDVNPKNAILITGLILCLFSLKNVLDLKLKMDALHAVIYFISFSIIFYSVWNTGQGWDGIFTFFDKHPEKRNLVPATHDRNAWFSLVVFLGIQWWSCYLFDGGGPEMARFTAVKGTKNAMLTGLLPTAISLILSFFILGHIFMILGLSHDNSSNEIQYVVTVFGSVANSLKPLVLLGFFGMFITTAESLLNWGASFLTMDGYKQYVNPNSSDKKIRIVSFSSMLFLSIMSILFALQIDSLQTLIKITFSIAAGVAPVYILRWIWFRINAWSQLSAMLSSAVFTLLYPQLHTLLPIKNFPMEETRILAVTILTTIVWLSVTFLTINQSEEVQLKMMPILERRSFFLRRFWLAIIFGIIIMLSITLSWSYILE